MTSVDILRLQTSEPPGDLLPDPADPSRPRLIAYGCEPAVAALFVELADRYGVSVTTIGADPSESNAALAKGFSMISVDHRTKLTSDLLLRFRRAGVRRIVTRSVGLDHIDVDHATCLGIEVEPVGYSPHGVADHTLMLILMVLRQARSILLSVAAGDHRPPLGLGRELRDLTVGVIGVGRIGSAVTERLLGFGAEVLIHDHRTARKAQVSLEELLRRSDVITLHLPLTADTRHTLDDRRIRLMKPGAVVINTGRGGLIDTAALLCALESGRLGGAGLDVVEDEEEVFGVDHRPAGLRHRWIPQLLALPSVVLTPHLAYRTDRALRDLVEHTLINSSTATSRSIHG